MTKRIRVVGGGGSCKFRVADFVDGGLTTPIVSDPIQDFPGLINFIRNDWSEDIEAVVYAQAGLIKDDQDTMEVCSNAHFLDGVKMATETKKILGVGSRTLNDMEPAVKGMAYLLNIEKFLGVTVGGGIGGRIFDFGRVLSTIVEIGHIVVDSSPFATLCGCGHRGHAEAYGGGKAVEQRVLAELAMMGVKLSDGQTAAQYMDDAYELRDEWAVYLYEEIIARALGLLFLALKCFHDFDTIVYKGSAAIAYFDHGIESPIRKVVAENAIGPTWAKDLKFIETPGLYDMDALLGTALIYQERGSV